MTSPSLGTNHWQTLTSIHLQLMKYLHMYRIPQPQESLSKALIIIILPAETDLSKCELQSLIIIIMCPQRNT